MKIVVFDFETQALASAYDKECPVWGVGFAGRGSDDKPVTWALTDPDEIREEFVKHIGDKNTVLVCHNASFDVAVLDTHYGLRLKPEKYHDTMLVAYSQNPSLGGIEKYSLESLCQKHFNIGKLPKPDFSKGWTPTMEKYCKMDCLLTLRLFYLLYPKLRNDYKAFEYYEKLDRHYTSLVIEMESNGAVIDRGKAEYLHRLYDRYCRLLERHIAKTHYALPGKEVIGRYTYMEMLASGEYSITSYSNSKGSKVWAHCKLDVWNRSSPQQNAQVLLLHGASESQMKTTKLGKLSVDTKSLEKIAPTVPLAKVLDSLNKATNMRDNFIGKLLTLSDNPSATIHASFNVCATKTHRLSSSKPNLQNVPARGIAGSRLRSCFIAPPGYSVVCGDLDRIELVVFAYLLEDAGLGSSMADAVRDGVDLHSFNAESWGLNTVYGPAKARWVAKKVIFTLIYGAGAALIASEMGCSLEEATQVRNMVLEATRIKELQGVAAKQCHNNHGTYHDFLGAKLYLPHILGSQRFLAERQLGNYMVQCPAGGIFKELQLRAKEALLNAQLDAKQIVVVHDEVFYYVWNGHVEEAISILDTQYCSLKLESDRGAIPVTAKFHAANTWAEAKQ